MLAVRVPSAAGEKKKANRLPPGPEKEKALEKVRAETQTHVTSINTLKYRKGALESKSLLWWQRQADVASVGTIEYDVIGNHNYTVPLIPGDEGKTLSSLKGLSVSCLLFHIEGLGHYQVNALPWLARKENLTSPRS